MSRSNWHGRESARLSALCLDVYGDTCHLCGRPGATTADHLVSRSKGGDNSIENLRPAHGPCNSSRGDMDLVEWFRRHPIRRVRSIPSRNWYG